MLVLLRRARQICAAYFHIIALILIYVCVVQAVSVLNAVYLGLFAGVLLLRRLALRAWIALLVYCEFVIFMIYLWRFPFSADAMSASLAADLGFRDPDQSVSLLENLAWNLAILTAAVLESEILRAQARSAQHVTHGVAPPSSAASTTPVLSSAVRLCVVVVRDGFPVLLAVVLVSVGVASTPSLINIGYVLLAFFMIALYQMGHRPRLLFLYGPLLWLMATYASAALLLMYVFQFSWVSTPLQERLPQARLQDIGLELHSSGFDLFGYLVGPTAVLACVVIEIILLRVRRRPVVATETGVLTWPTEMDLGGRTAGAVVTALQRLVCLQAPGLVLICLFAACIADPSVVGLASLAVWLPLFSTTSARRLWPADCVAQLWAMCVALAKVLWQLSFWAPEDIQFRPGNVSDASWFGLSKPPDSSAAIAGYILLVTALFAHAVARRWRMALLQRGSTASASELPGSVALFATWNPHKDASIVPAVKSMLANAYGVIGLEVCTITAAIAAFVRLNVFGLVYLILAGLWSWLPRRRTRAAWPYFVIGLIVLILLQYLFILQFPPSLAIPPPYFGDTRSWVLGLVRWLYLPPNQSPLVLIGDFCLLYFVVAQATVFDDECARERPDADVDAPLPVMWNFLQHPRTFAASVKVMVYRYAFWFVLVFVFVSGAVDITLLNYGYILAAFWFFHYGETLILMRHRRERQWNYMRIFNYTVLLVRCSYQAAAYMADWTAVDTALRDFLDIVGLRRGMSLTLPDSIFDDVELAWSGPGILTDVLVFVFLLLQSRLFASPEMGLIEHRLRSDYQASHRRAERQAASVRHAYAEMQANEIEVQRVTRRRIEYLKSRQQVLAEEHARRGGVVKMKVFQSPEDMFVDLPPEADEAPDRKGDNEGDGAAVAAPGERGVDPVQLDSGGSIPTEQNAAAAAAAAAAAGAGAGAQLPLYSAAPASESEEQAPLAGAAAVQPRKTGWTSWLRPKMHRIIRRMNLATEQINYDSRVDLDMPASEIGSAAAHVGVADTTGPAEWAGAAVEDATARPASHDDATVSVVPVAAIGADDELGAGAVARPVSESLLLVFLRALGHWILAYSAWGCYFAMVLNALVSPNLMSVVYPLVLFLTLWTYRPRPSARYWLAMIAYTEVIISVRYLFQFDWWSFNVTNLPSDWPVLLGIQRSDTLSTFWRATSVDLLVLLSFLLHRASLRHRGLWVDSAMEFAFASSRASIGDKHDGAAENVGFTDEETGLAEPASGAAAAAAAAAATAAATLPTAVAAVATAEADVGASRRVASMMQSIADTSGMIPRDFYRLMTIFDLLSMFVMFFGWSAFENNQAAGNIRYFFSEDVLPMSFVLVLMTQSFIILVDRLFYLRHAIWCKIVLHVFQVLLVHLWFFFLMPVVLGSQTFNSYPALVLFYLMKCAYFLMSMLQLKFGYPKRHFRYLMARRATFGNWLVSVIYRTIPFLMELRYIIDWTGTPTALPLGEWIKMEDIRSEMFSVKMTIVERQKSKRAPGEAQSLKWKFTAGLLSAGGILVIIWLPLLLIALTSTAAVRNPPQTASMTVSMVGYEPLFQMAASQNVISTASAAQYNSLMAQYGDDGFVDRFAASDIVRMQFYTESLSLWSISPPNRQALLLFLRDSPLDAFLRVEFTFMRVPISGLVQAEIRGTQDLQLTPNSTERLALVAMLASNASGTPMAPNDTILSLYPSFMYVPVVGEAGPVPDPVMAAVMPNCSLMLSSRPASNATAPDSRSEWWSLRMLSPPVLPDPATQPGWMEVWSFNERAQNPNYLFISSIGIIGLYVSVVLVVSRFLRMAVTGLSHNIMFQNLPCVDALLCLCDDIYRAREFNDLDLEEMLYGELIMLYRSPELLIEWTQEKLKRD